MRRRSGRERGGPTLTRSQAEEVFRDLIRAADLPEPEVNVWIPGFEVDFLWHEQRLIVEIDGFRYHSTARAFEHDRRKDAVMHAHGLSTLRFTPRALTREQPRVVVRVAQGLSR